MALNSTTIIIICFTVCYAHNNFERLCSIEDEVVNCSDDYVLTQRNWT
jgi:hypothetical protein